MADEEEEMTISSYSVAELWQRLSLHLAKDIVSYFSFHDVGQKPRYEYMKQKPAFRSTLGSFMCLFQGVTRLEVVAIKSGRFQPRHSLPGRLRCPLC